MYFDVTTRITRMIDRVFVEITYFIFLLAVIVNIAYILIVNRKGQKEDRPMDILSLLKSYVLDKKFILFLLLILYYLAIVNLGFYLSSFFLFIVTSYYLGERRVIYLVSVPLMLLLVIFVANHYLIRIDIPSGRFF